MTNYERIKSMNVEELGELISDIADNPCDYCADRTDVCCVDFCCEIYSRIGKWLESEAQK